MKLDIRDLSGGYGNKIILKEITFSVNSGSVVTLLGPNGCGKSTLLKMIGRILKPSCGTICIDGRNIETFPPCEFARNVASLPQLHDIPEEITVGELVAFGRFPHRRMQLQLSRHDREIIDSALEMTRLSPMRNRTMATLSGGERQRAWIAMAIAQEPGVLLLDEPTTFLDVCYQFEMIEIIRSLNRKQGMTIVMVLHDLNLAASCADELLMMKAGRICYSGPPQEIMTPEILREIFEIHSKISIFDGPPYCIATGSAHETENISF